MYRSSVRQSLDPFKQVVYLVLGALEPLASLDYLWLKLSQVHEGEA